MSVIGVEESQKQNHAAVHARLMGSRPKPMRAIPAIVIVPQLDEILATPGLTWQEGVNAILGAFNATRQQLIAKPRDRQVVACRRAIAVYLLEKHNFHPSAIAKVLVRDRTTILNLLNPRYRENKRNYRLRKISP